MSTSAIAADAPAAAASNRYECKASFTEQVAVKSYTLKLPEEVEADYQNGIPPEAEITSTKDYNPELLSGGYASLGYSASTESSPGAPMQAWVLYWKEISKDVRFSFDTADVECPTENLCFVKVSVEGGEPDGFPFLPFETSDQSEPKSFVSTTLAVLIGPENPSDLSMRLSFVKAAMDEQPNRPSQTQGFGGTVAEDGTRRIRFGASASSDIQVPGDALGLAVEVDCTRQG